jgi:hypothetical protein
MNREPSSPFNYGKSSLLALLVGAHSGHVRSVVVPPVGRPSDTSASNSFKLISSVEWDKNGGGVGLDGQSN